MNGNDSVGPHEGYCDELVVLKDTYDRRFNRYIAFLNKQISKRVGTKKVIRKLQKVIENYKYFISINVYSISQTKLRGCIKAITKVAKEKSLTNDEIYCINKSLDSFENFNKKRDSCLERISSIRPESLSYLPKFPSSNLSTKQSSPRPMIKTRNGHKNNSDYAEIPITIKEVTSGVINYPIVTASSDAIASLLNDPTNLDIEDSTEMSRVSHNYLYGRRIPNPIKNQSIHDDGDIMIKCTICKRYVPSSCSAIHSIKCEEQHNKIKNDSFDSAVTGEKTQYTSDISVLGMDNDSMVEDDKRNIDLKNIRTVSPIIGDELSCELFYHQGRNSEIDGENFNNLNNNSNNSNNNNNNMNGDNINSTHCMGEEDKCKILENRSDLNRGLRRATSTIAPDSHTLYSPINYGRNQKRTISRSGSGIFLDTEKSTPDTQYSFGSYRSPSRSFISPLNNTPVLRSPLICRSFTDITFYNDLSNIRDPIINRIESIIKDGERIQKIATLEIISCFGQRTMNGKNQNLMLKNNRRKQRNGIRTSSKSNQGNSDGRSFHNSLNGVSGNIENKNYSDDKWKNGQNNTLTNYSETFASYFENDEVIKNLAIIDNPRGLPIFPAYNVKSIHSLYGILKLAKTCRYENKQPPSSVNKNINNGYGDNNYYYNNNGDNKDNNKISRAETSRSEAPNYEEEYFSLEKNPFWGTNTRSSLNIKKGMQMNTSSSMKENFEIIKPESGTYGASGEAGLPHFENSSEMYHGSLAQTSLKSGSNKIEETLSVDYDDENNYVYCNNKTKNLKKGKKISDNHHKSTYFRGFSNSSNYDFEFSKLRQMKCENVILSICRDAMTVGHFKYSNIYEIQQSKNSKISNRTVSTRVSSYSNKLTNTSSYITSYNSMLFLLSFECDVLCSVYNLILNILDVFKHSNQIEMRSQGTLSSESSSSTSYSYSPSSYSNQLGNNNMNDKNFQDQLNSIHESIKNSNITDSSFDNKYENNIRGNHMPQFPKIKLEPCIEYLQCLVNSIKPFIVDKITLDIDPLRIPNKVDGKLLMKEQNGIFTTSSHIIIPYMKYSSYMLLEAVFLIVGSIDLNDWNRRVNLIEREYYESLNKSTKQLGKNVFGQDDIFYDEFNCPLTLLSFCFDNRIPISLGNGETQVIFNFLDDQNKELFNNEIKALVNEDPYLSRTCIIEEEEPHTTSKRLTPEANSSTQKDGINSYRRESHKRISSEQIVIKTPSHDLSKKNSVDIAEKNNNNENEDNFKKYHNKNENPYYGINDWKINIGNQDLELINEETRPISDKENHKTCEKKDESAFVDAGNILSPESNLSGNPDNNVTNMETGMKTTNDLNDSTMNNRIQNLPLSSPRDSLCNRSEYDQSTPKIDKTKLEETTKMDLLNIEKGQKEDDKKNIISIRTRKQNDVAKASTNIQKNINYENKLRSCINADKQSKQNNEWNYLKQELKITDDSIQSESDNTNTTTTIQNNNKGRDFSPISGPSSFGKTITLKSQITPSKHSTLVNNMAKRESYGSLPGAFDEPHNFNNLVNNNPAGISNNQTKNPSKDDEAILKNDEEKKEDNDDNKKEKKIQLSIKIPAENKQNTPEDDTYEDSNIWKKTAEMRLSQFYKLSIISKTINSTIYKVIHWKTQEIFAIKCIEMHKFGVKNTIHNHSNHKKNKSENKINEEKKYIEAIYKERDIHFKLYNKHNMFQQPEMTSRCASRYGSFFEDSNNENSKENKPLSRDPSSYSSNYNYLSPEELLEYYSCPPVIRFYTCFSTSSHLFLVLEYCANGSLFDLLSIVGTVTKYSLLRQITTDISIAVSYLHANNVTHRDLKPSNIVIDNDGRFKLIDFGISVEGLMERIVGEDGPNMKDEVNTDNNGNGIDDNSVRHVVGTPYYIAPELLSGSLVNYTSDWFSVGVILYEVFYGVTPYSPENRDNLIINYNEEEEEEEEEEKDSNNNNDCASENKNKSFLDKNMIKGEILNNGGISNEYKGSENFTNSSMTYECETGDMNDSDSSSYYGNNTSIDDESNEDGDDTKERLDSVFHNIINCEINWEKLGRELADRYGVEYNDEMSENFPGVRCVLPSLDEDYAQGIAFLKLIRGMLVKEPKKRVGVNGLSDIIDGEFVSIWGLTKPRWCPKNPLKKTKDVEVPDPDWWRVFQPNYASKSNSLNTMANNASSLKSESLYIPQDMNIRRFTLITDDWKKLQGDS